MKTTIDSESGTVIAKPIHRSGFRIASIANDKACRTYNSQGAATFPPRSQPYKCHRTKSPPTQEQCGRPTSDRKDGGSGENQAHENVSAEWHGLVQGAGMCVLACSGAQERRAGSLTSGESKS